METRETLAVLKQLPNITVVTKLLSQRLGCRCSFSEGMGIFELQPRSKAAAEFLFFARALYPQRKGKGLPRATKKKISKKVAPGRVNQKTPAAKKVSQRKATVTRR